MKSMGVIYKATCIINGKCYIGQTKDFEKRKNQHLKAHDGYTFHNAIEKYGSNQFVWEILEKCPLEELNDREKYWIKYYNSYKNGYNMTSGGDNADSLLEWRRKNPDKVRKNALNGLKAAQKYNKEHPEETLLRNRKNIAKATEATKRKVYCVELNLIFNSIAEAERWSQSSSNPNGKTAHHQHISKVCSGKRNICGGYHWKYIDKEKEE